mmetsp:Transcript_23687/g.68077  ORF Transcript_23687/g.68077 Transcript_23687/m.68077 type:complete len:316 (+) Transcript_23687:115-1062(+)
MRFGKKLALHMMSDDSGAPYLSHKPMKEAINCTVRELRKYQAKTQSMEKHGAVDEDEQALAELEARITAFDREFLDLVDEDIARILSHIRQGEAQLQSQLEKLQRRLVDAGLLLDEAQFSRLEQVLPNRVEDKARLCRQLLALRMQSDPVAALREQQASAVECNAFLSVAAQHAQYMEVNVAGFRKLLKRHEKQIPQVFRARLQPCLRFHRLVTRTSRALLETASRIRTLVLDARRRFEEELSPDQIAHAKGFVGDFGPDISEFRGLGPECEMVLEIRRQLRDMDSNELPTTASPFSAATPGAEHSKRPTRSAVH